jgi:hypothetical protein
MNAVQLAPTVTIDEYYELRLYEMIPTRMPDFHELMRDHVPRIFARVGVSTPLALWEGYASPLAPLYAYCLPWRSLDERMRAWKRFYADPEWIDKLSQNYAGMQRVERSNVFILRPSPIWSKWKQPGASGPIEGVHELRFHDVLNQDPNQAHEALSTIDLPFLTARGAIVLGLFATWFGARMNQAVTLLAWPDSATMQSAYREHRDDEKILAARDAERRAHGRPLLRGADIHIMRPLPYGIPHANLAPSA